MKLQKSKGDEILVSCSLTPNGITYSSVATAQWNPFRYFTDALIVTWAHCFNKVTLPSHEFLGFLYYSNSFTVSCDSQRW